MKTYDKIVDMVHRKYKVPTPKLSDTKILLLNFDNKNGNKTKHWTATVSNENACNGVDSLEVSINEPKMEEVIDSDSDSETLVEPYLLKIRCIENIKIVIA